MEIDWIKGDGLIYNELIGRKRKFFITGSTGFIGANLVRKIIQNDEVHLLIRKGADLWRLKDVMKKKNLHIHRGDLLDFEKLKKLLEEINPEFIIHLAVYGGLPYQKNVKKIYKTNLNGTINLLNASKDINYKCFINTGSSSEYGEKDSSMKETDLLEPNTDYGISKSTATLYCNNFAKKHNKPIITVRLFSPYGYFEDKGRLFPYVINSILKEKTLEIGNPNAVRDFIFIEDVVDAYLKIINHNKFFCGEVFNISSGEQHSVQEVIDTISDLTKKTNNFLLNKEKARSFDTSCWVGDISKIKKVFGWSPKYSFLEGIEKNVEWFKNNLNEIESLKKQANEMRFEIAKILEECYGSHIGGDYSVLDILNVLYFKIMKINPENPLDPKRDKLILSKGHNSIALYSVLAKRGFFDESRLKTYCKDGSHLEGHVNSYNIPGVEVSTGSLGHGLAIGIGMAIASKQDNGGRVFVILGDGECNEGSIWEAAILASRLKLENLTVIVDANKFQGFDSTEEVYGDNKKLIEMWKSSGFEVREINGNNYEELIETFKDIPFNKSKPSLIFANTKKGKGVSFMEERLEWHYKSPNKEQLKIIEEELNEKCIYKKNN